ncbi:MAG: type II toxin-antitoxin system RelE/ParE family toxin [Lachnospiraceae bacterium]|nr:type II toxin-antitoxin system RelE/ParE family toxin [Lachnospiraceae bacterium]MDD3616747.1 type II toxin-antitoxin system RelE/ParE family toxin [Lachnospiraceae bacterium]
MNNIVIYEDARGKSDFENYLSELNTGKAKNKNYRIQFQKIVVYIRMLKEYGNGLNEPYAKYLEDGIWELRPLDNRILYAYMNLQDYLSRRGKNV